MADHTAGIFAREDDRVLLQQLRALTRASLDLSNDHGNRTSWLALYL